MILNAKQVADIWTRNGGAQSAVVNAVAVSLAESGWRTDAVSPADDHGLWQINSMHFREFNVNAQTVLDVDTNAHIAVALSGAGSNWAAWCTCWLNPDVDCGHGFLQNPQNGSPAGNKVAQVRADLGQQGPFLNVPVNSDALTDTNIAWDNFRYVVGPWHKSAWDTQKRLTTQIRGMIQ